jgi:hypothetical protein
LSGALSFPFFLLSLYHPLNVASKPLRSHAGSLERKPGEGTFRPTGLDASRLQESPRGIDIGNGSYRCHPIEFLSRPDPREEISSTFKFHFHSIIDLKKVYGSPELQGIVHDTSEKMEMAFWEAKNISHFCNSDDPGQSGETATRGILSQHARDRLGACRSMQARSDDLLLRVVRELVGFYFPVIQLRGTK